MSDQKDYEAALRELVLSVERMADIGKRREKTVSNRMEEALKTAKALLGEDDNYGKPEWDR